MRLMELSFFFYFLLLPLGLTGQEESIHKLHFHFQNSHKSLIGVSVSEANIPVISSSILAAENWLKIHVLAHFPSKNITMILLGRNILCNRDLEQELSLILPSVKNLYNSLTRWGLQEEIKISPVFSSNCLNPLNFYRRYHLLIFLQKHSLPYIIESNSYSPPSLLQFSHRSALEKLGFSGISDIRVLRAMKPIPGNLPEKPKRLGLGLKDSQFAPVPDSSLFFAPYPSPDEIPTNPPDAVGVPSTVCLPAKAPAPRGAEENNGGLWCVAKPTVPVENLQEAINYACGEGGADCEEIKPNGKCYFPDNIIAHASYAFNSYWQKKKEMGGSCSFHGMAMLINSDPSYLQCKFLLD